MFQFPIMKSMKQDLLALASSTKNKSFIATALKEIAKGSAHPKPIIPGPGCSESEVEFFNKVVNLKLKITDEKGVLKADGKVILFEPIHCEIFQLISGKFFAQNTKALLLLLKDEFIFVDKKIMKKHKECQCFLKPFTKFSKVSELIKLMG